MSRSHVLACSVVGASMGTGGHACACTCVPECEVRILKRAAWEYFHALACMFNIYLVHAIPSSMYIVIYDNMCMCLGDQSYKNAWRNAM